MVAKPIYIPDTYFRFIPNPTTFSWNRKNFSLRKLLLQYHEALKSNTDIEKTEQICQLVVLGRELRKHLDKWENEEEFSMGLLSTLNGSIQACDSYLAPANDKDLKSYRFKNVKLVIREHVQKVMKILNVSGTGNDADHSDDRTLSSKDRLQEKESAALDELNSAAPEARNAKLIEIYFKTVRPDVLKNCYESLTDDSYIPSMQSRDNLTNMVSVGAKGEKRGGNEEDQEGTETPGLEMRSRAVTPSSDVDDQAEGEKNEAQEYHRHTHENEFADVWCTLMFRMLCWLLLHDIHKKDVQVSKSELYGSRLPVYIS